jgi:hypothetical protein
VAGTDIRSDQLGQQGGGAGGPRRPDTSLAWPSPSLIS